jgi:hypothetical protein
MSRIAVGDLGGCVTPGDLQYYLGEFAKALMRQLPFFGAQGGAIAI